MGDKGRARQDKPKALTVRLNKASVPPQSRRGKVFCRVSTENHSHDTPKRPCVNNFVEWKCILVFPYMNDRFLKIEMKDDSTTSESAFSLFQLAILKDSPTRQFKGQLAMDDNSTIDVEISLYPRPSLHASKNSGALAPKNPDTPAVDSSRPGSPRGSDKDDAFHDGGDDDLDQEAHEALMHTVNFFAKGDPKKVEQAAPVLVTIGNVGGPIYERIEVHPDKSLMAKKGSHPSGLPSIWVEMAGGTTALGGPEAQVGAAPSLWTDLCGPMKNEATKSPESLSTGSPSTNGEQQTPPTMSPRNPPPQGQHPAQTPFGYQWRYGAPDSLPRAPQRPYYPPGIPGQMQPAMQGATPGGMGNSGYAYPAQQPSYYPPYPGHPAFHGRYQFPPRPYDSRFAPRVEMPPQNPHWGPQHLGYSGDGSNQNFGMDERGGVYDTSYGGGPTAPTSGQGRPIAPPGWPNAW